MDLLLPRSDSGVAIQIVVAAIVSVAGLAIVWRQRELRIFVLGIVSMTFAWFALRAVH